MKKLVFLTIIIFLCMFTKVQAQDIGLTVSPANLEVKVEDKNKIFEFNVKNNQSGRVTLELVKAEINSSEVKFTNLDPTSPANWIEFISQDNFSLDSEETTKVQFKLNNILSHTSNPLILIRIKNDSNNGATFEQNIPFQVKVISFLQNNDVLIEQFEATKSIVFDDKISFNIKFKNSQAEGTSKPIGYFQVVNSKGQTIKQTTINENLSSLDKEETLSKQFEVNLQNIMDFGEMRAELLVVDSITQRSVIKKVSFFYLPLILPIAAIVGLIIFANLILYIRKPKKNRKKESVDDYKPKSVLKL